MLGPGDATDLDTLKGAWDAAGKDDPFWSVLSVRAKQKNRTLQHVGPANARSYLKEFIRVLVPGGVLVFQLPGRQTGRLRRLKALAPAPLLAAYRRLRYHGHPTATMCGIPREDVVRFCETNGAAVLDVQANHEAGAGWESFRYYGRRVSSPDSQS